MRTLSAVCVCFLALACSRNSPKETAGDSSPPAEPKDSEAKGSPAGLSRSSASLEQART